MMGRALAIVVLLWVLCALSVRAENPDDIDFVLRLTKDTPVYHTGEVIEFEISYSGRSERKYRGSWTTPSPDLEVVTLHVTPSQGVFDRRRLRDSLFAGSILSGIGYLGSQPVTMTADLAGWYRFDKPGYYTLAVTSPQVSRLKSAEEGGGEEPVTLESNTVEFDVLPPDGAWERQELWSIQNALENAADAGEKERAYHRLTVLDTPASVEKLVQLYLTTSDTSAESYTFYRALRESSHVAVIVPLLEAALSDPMANPLSNLARLLASLQVVQEVGPPPPQPLDPATRDEWQKKLQERDKVRDRYFARDNDLVLASLRRRSGPQRAGAIYQAWYNAEQLNATKPIPPATLAQLRLDVIGVAKDLPLGQQSQFLALAWNTMEHEQLRPLVRDLALQHHDASAFQFWCEAWGDDCAAGILASAVNPDSQLPPYIVLLLPEAAHPELDPVLKERLKEAFARQDFLMAHRTAVLVLRAGSRSLRASVDALLAADPASRPNSCEVQGYLVGYLFRVAPEDAAKFLIAKFADRSDVCAGQLFHTLNAARYSDDLVPIAVKALNSPNPGAVGSAALLLGERGPNSVEDALWRRLRAFWEIWRDRKTELRGTLPGDDGQFETALLEQQLASALAHATNWKLTPAEQDRLREGCLTEQCRAVAEGNMYLNP